MRKAFTLLEILIVVAIIAILAGLLFPILRSAKRRATETVDISNMRQLYMACTMYEQDQNGVAPALQADFKGYAGDVRLYRSPNDVYRAPYSDGTWPGEPLLLCTGTRSPFRLSYAYLKNFPEPYDVNVQDFASARGNPLVGLFASPWSGEPTPTLDWTSSCGDNVPNQTGPRMEGPILRIDMDGSFFRLPRNRNIGAIGSPQDLFIYR